MVARFNGEKLRRRRRVCDMTARELANLAGVSTWTVSAWETGKHSPTDMNVCYVAKHLESGIADFYDGEAAFMVPMFFMDGESVQDLAERFDMMPSQIEESIRRFARGTQ